MPFFEGFYASPFQHPLLLWLSALAGIAFVRCRADLSGDVRFYCYALGVLSLCDAWLTSNAIPGLGRLPEALSEGVPLFFVLAGDFRYLLLLGIARAGGGFSLGAARIAVALGLTLVVPIASQIVMTLVPEASRSSRLLFLVYESFFVLLTLGLMRLHPGVREHRWLRSVSRFVLVYYGLWALADAIILGTGSDLGFLLRLVPNVLYYGGLIAVIGKFAPSSDEASMKASMVDGRVDGRVDGHVDESIVNHEYED